MASALPFTYAEGRSTGLTASHLAGPALVTPARGVRSATLPQTIAEQYAVVSRAIRRPFAVSHVSAALLLGWPVPLRARMAGGLHIMTCSDSGQIRMPFVVGHRGLESRRVIEVDGVPVIHPVETWVDLGELVGRGKPFGFDDIICAGDQAMNIIDSVDELIDEVMFRNRPRGKNTLLAAIPLLRKGSESGGETRARLCFVRARLPEPTPNVRIHRHGTVVARGDLVWEAVRTIAEYQGRPFHNDPADADHDKERFKALEAAGWHVIPVESEDLTVRAKRDVLLTRVAERLRFPLDRIDHFAAEPQFFAPARVEPFRW